MRPGQHPQEFMGVLGQYARAVDYLFNAIAETGFSADHCSYPLLYLLRHTLEVGLKANIQYIAREGSSPLRGSTGHGHDLGKLRQEFITLVEAQDIMDQETLAFFHQECLVMQDLIKLMPSASSFRYTEETNGSRVFGSEVFDIAKLKPAFERSRTILAYTPAVLFGA